MLKTWSRKPMRGCSACMACRNAQSPSDLPSPTAPWRSMSLTECVFVPSGCSSSVVQQGNPTKTVRWVEKETRMNSNQPEIEAGEWLARLDRNDPSAADIAAFDRWKATDPRHAAAYARLAATWQALDRLRAIRPSADEPIDNDYLNSASQ